MKISPPCIITSRLLPGLALNGGTLSIEYAHGTVDGRMVYRYFIDISNSDHPDATVNSYGVEYDPEGEPVEAFKEYFEYSNDDLSSGVGSWSLQEGLSALLSFLLAAAESKEYDERNGTEPDEPYGFPNEVLEWAIQNSDDLGYFQEELEEGRTVIDETVEGVRHLTTV